MKTLARIAALLVMCTLALQLYFLARVLLMRVVDPRSTTFQRSEAWRLLGAPQPFAWRQQWVDHASLSPNLKRAVIAAEDAGFVDHAGVDWEAIEKAWERNRQAEARMAAPAAAGKAAAAAAGKAAAAAAAKALPARPLKIVGGSTITQQLAKNLFLGGERSWPRKAQEFVITGMLETLLPKERILEIYLNHVEWGAGVFGAEAAARRYFGLGAGELSSLQAARLAVMLPAPKRFEQRPTSAYVVGRAATVAARMGAVVLP